MKIVVVSPHRDDAAFSLDLSIEHWLQAGHKVHVLNCFTQSEYAPFSDVDSLHANDRRSFATAVRKREDLAWSKLLGGKMQLTDLDLLDAPLRLACGVDEVLSVPIRAGDRAVNRVAGLLAKLARNSGPQELCFVLPLAIGGHIDHRIARQAGLDSLGELNFAVAFYEDLPYVARPGAAETVAPLVAELPWPVQPAFAFQAAGDAASAVARKLRVAECYDSQVDSDVVQQISDFCSVYGGREQLWANPAWLADPVLGVEIHH